MKIILASQSPRRKELLQNMGLEFDVFVSITNEDMTQKVRYEKLSEILSKQKAQDVFEKTQDERIVIGSDCMVYIGHQLLGKPKDKQDAKRMLYLLSGKWHKVVSGLCVLVYRNGDTKQYLCHDITKVKFKKLTEKDIERYLSFDEYKDKAGSYAIQGMAGMFVDKVIGNLSTVIGLPTQKLFEILKKENIL